MLVLSLSSFIIYLAWSFYYFRKDIPYIFKPRMEKKD
jgi:hypothetical protein